MKNPKLMRCLDSAWLTSTGLLTYCEPEDVYFFCSNAGEFRRYATKEEAHNLEGFLPEVTFAHNQVCTYLPEKWRFLWSWKISDYTSYKDGTSSNGGNYAFHETHNIFGRMNAGKLELLDVVRHTTSAEFSYDEANGGFRSDGMGDAFFIDCEPIEVHPLGGHTVFSMHTQIGYGSSEREYSLNQFGQPISWFDAVNAGDFSFGMEGDEEPFLEDATCGPVEAKRRLKILKDTFDWP